MKLCYIANANSIHTRRWIRPFVEQGYTIHLLSYKPVERQLSGVKVVDLTRITNVRKVRFAYWGWWIRRYVHRLQPDILHAHQLQAAGWLGMMAGYHPFVVSGWGSDILVEPHKSALRRLLVKVVLRQCDRLIVPSQLMYDAAKSLGVTDSHLHLIPWGIETDIFRPTPDDRLATRRQFGIGENARVVFCPRSISPLYNIDVVLEAVKAVVSQYPSLRLVLLRFGVNSDYLSKLERMISANDLRKVVVWLPAQEFPSDMAQLYRMSDVVVSIPSSEGYGFTVYEAMATGCPTVVSDLPVFKNELRHEVHTLRVPVRDVEKTSQAIAALLTNLDLRQKLRQNALNVCQEKSVAKRVEQADALYRKLIGKPCNT